MSTSIIQAPRSWRGARVLVTGASGFIGSHLVRKLTDLGAEVHAASRRRPNLEGAAHHLVDLTDADACVELIGAAEPDVVFHLASEVTGSRDVDLVIPLMAANQAAAVHLLTAVVKSAPAARVVLAGSIEEPHQADDLIPCSPYAAAKWAATAYARMFSALYDVRVSVAQIAMVYGPAQRDISKLVPYATLAMLRGEALRLSSGTKLADWVYVDDVVDALIRAAEADAAIGQVFDICSGHMVSIRQTVELLASIIGRDARQLQFSALTDRSLDRAQSADPRAAAELVGWNPSTSLEDGLHKTVAWYAENVREVSAADGQTGGGVRSSQ